MSCRGLKILIEDVGYVTRRRVMSITEKLVEYTISARFEDMPGEAVAKTKELILDEIGNALGLSLIHISEPTRPY